MSEKETEYGAICYFKIVDNDCRKMKPIISLEENDLRMPYWSTEQEDLILKVKSKYCADEYEPLKMYFIDIMFTSYCIEEPSIKGYFCKIPSMICKSEPNPSCHLFYYTQFIIEAFFERFP